MISTRCLLGHHKIGSPDLSPHHTSPVPLVRQMVQRLHHTSSLLFLLLLDVQPHCIQVLGVEHLEELLYYNIRQVLVVVPVLVLAPVQALAPVLAQVKVHAILFSI